MIYPTSANSNKAHQVNNPVMNYTNISFYTFTFFATCISCLWSSGVGGYSASNTFTVNSGNATYPTYKVASASISGDAVFTGVVDSVSSSAVSFATGTDENNATIYPFAGTNVFNPSIQIPNLSASRTSTSVSSISVTYPGGYDSSGSGFTSVPDLIIDLPSGGDDGAIAVATLTSGEITGVSITSGGSSYTSDPSVTIVGGPHFVKNTTEGSANYGRYFLISSNTQSSLSLDYSRLASGESTSASSYFAVGDTVEVVPAPTLGSVFGRDPSDLPSNWSYGLPQASDWVYFLNHEYNAYIPYFFLGTSYESAGYRRGWWMEHNIHAGVQTNQVLYPDEAFIIAKRTSGNVTFEFAGTLQTSDQKMLLPAGDKRILMNNPYGTDLLLGELIPSTSIGSGNSLFNWGTTYDGSGTDLISTLQANGTWLNYYYDSDVSSDNITAMHEIGTRSPREGGGAASTMDADDFYIGSGAISALDSCTDDAGSNTLTDSNDGNFTKITLSGAPTDLIGFQITLTSLQGYKLNSDGSKEVNASTGLEVDSPARGSIIFSNLIGTHEVVGSGSGYVVVEKQRDINLKADESDENSNTCAWSIGSLGTTSPSGGYTGYFFCVGGGASSNAKGTVSANGLTFTVSSGGSGYSSSPQVVVTGGGWRVHNDLSTPAGDTIIGADDGVMITRRKLTGVNTFVLSSNPNK